MLELHDIHLRYNRGSADEVRALQGLSVTIPDRQFATVVGTNGAGKSSLIQVLSGSARPTSGKVILNGRDVTKLPDYRRAGLVTRVFDDPRAGTAPGLSIEDNLALALTRGRRRGLRLALSGSRRDIMRERLAMLGLGLENRLGDRIGLLSAGQRQSVTMIMAALSTPEVLLLDEHLAALDPKTTATVLGITTDLVRELGCMTLMVTHNMEHAIALGDRLLVMNAGKLIADFGGEEKKNLTVDRVVDAIAGAGGVLSDRSLLAERTP
ncbi:ABC transporter ATP-binding protein [Rhodococcoides fascians]|uniref:ABC transporter ATP-binding protein n=1 Tax=Rhodococcoides fascians TaxID=1828 RepID=UPI00050BF4B7|nr:ATP-binding cassette domain-containing protein [Rhodococcus fascians]